MTFLLGVTQRVDINKTYGERRDALDQAWTRFLHAAGYGIVPLPNGHPDIAELSSGLNLDGLVLTGGNNITLFTGKGLYENENPGTAPERDKTEIELLRLSLARNWPVLGFCRGMQMINLFHGGHLSLVNSHVSDDHALLREDGDDHTQLRSLLPESCNSYHDYGVAQADLSDQLSVLARAEDKTIEALAHQKKCHFGVMWHPERYHEPREADLALMRYIFT